ncbi:MAG: hypothetical protein ACRDWS_15335 [Acidimicrobiia bacterium]
MSIGWRIWFALLIVAALYGLSMIGDAREAADLNVSLAQGAPQQTVAGVWMVADLATILIYELIVVVVAIASVGLLLISRDEASNEREVAEPPHRGAHVERTRSDDQKSK